MSNLFEHCRAGVSTAKPKIRKVERRNKRQLDYAERKHLRRSRRLGNSGIALSRCFSGSDRTEKPHRIHVVGIIGQTGMLRPPESDAAGVPHTLRNDALQPIVMGRQPRFHIGKRVVKRIVDAAERRRKRPIFAQYRPRPGRRTAFGASAEGRVPEDNCGDIFSLSAVQRNSGRYPRGRNSNDTLRHPSPE